MSTILIIDDEEKIRTLLARIITLEGFEVFQASDLKKGLKRLEEQDIDVVICDVKLPDGSGVDSTKVIKEKYPLIEIILLTAYGNIPDGVQAIKNGAFDYITKGDDNNKIIPLVNNASEKVALAKRVQKLEKQLGDRYSFDKIVGKSKPILNAIDLAKRVAVTDTTVLLTGDTGTGKEVFAQAIHQASNRSKFNFVAINCAAFSKELLEGELFGHKAGSFTGAMKDQRGLFEEANKGTIFLDEIGEMPVELQAKILRVLETGEFLKIGETKVTRVDVRIIAATNRNLEEEIANEHFRSDLFYRLSVFSIYLPALRERKQDIHLLANHFTQIFSLRAKRKELQISPEYITALENHQWKGNIRELKNCIERSVILSDNDVLCVDTLPFASIAVDSGVKMLSAFSMASVEKVHIQKVLHHTQGNKAEAARLLEIGIATLYRKIEEYKLIS
ncbi:MULTISPECIES: sigma-54-dependent transcriptional regulator [Sphingobacterium]|uniref:Sigma-54 dependent transcriptional regulator n=2 Tax=Sphingobacterium TaxID=28453 RepID=A0ABV0BQW4_9SPHI|nr:MULTISPECIES: sigma-54 dependent transcriptional regulator [Sphingobacterium]MCS3553896.1 DNA-binding NtrC family response regulator [Sphingobacterium sp. JUb21]MCW2260554.1 DNA-binding NtrC family response regulator [Sphingobacterium kitahiroshimense]NJI75938.1 sigma-54-dependent Fis family transcriptional regulator [Sphingobacterium sp. B16(2022)]QQD13815.1 sigma-54-dependent Fis family transcriptional regulator [Sphingobacterium sp. UDSM-2020]TCR05215.1 DNA-binding NtrC family response r